MTFAFIQNLSGQGGGNKTVFIRELDLTLGKARWWGWLALTAQDKKRHLMRAALGLIRFRRAKARSRGFPPGSGGRRSRGCLNRAKLHGRVDSSKPSFRWVAHPFTCGAKAAARRSGKRLTAR